MIGDWYEMVLPMIGLMTLGFVILLNGVENP